MRHLLLFMAAGIIALAVPGPDFAIVVRNAVTKGSRAGVFTAFGIGTALTVHGAAATLGLSAVLATSAQAFTLVKMIGACYLAFLGFQALRSALRSRRLEAVPANGDGTDCDVNTGNPTRAFRQGALTNLLNPKAALFFLSFLPQFVPDSGSQIAWTAVLAATMAIMAVTWFTVLALLAARIKSFLSRPRVTRVFDGTTGGVFVGLAAKLAFSHR